MNTQTLLNHDILSKKELYDLIEKYQTAPNNSREKQKALNSIIKHNYKFVFKISSKIFYNRTLRTLELQDLITIGMRGITKAADQFNLELNLSFTTYAYWKILSEITRAIENTERVIRWPSHLVSDIRKLRKEFYIFREANQRTPSKEELSELTGFSLCKIENLTNIISRSNTISLNKTVKQESSNPLELLDIIPDTTTDDSSQTELRNLLFQSLDCLTLQEKNCIISRFGLDGAPKRSLAEVGKLQNYSRERARQLELVALRKLRANLEVKELFDLYLCKAA